MYYDTHNTVYQMFTYVAGDLLIVKSLDLSFLCVYFSTHRLWCYNREIVDGMRVVWAYNE